MASFYVRGRGTGPRGGRGRGHGLPSTYRRMDNNIFAVLSEHGDLEQNGDNVDVHFNENSYLDMTVGYDSDKNDWDVVRSKQTKRQRVSSSDQSGHDVDLLSSQMEHDTGEPYNSLSTDDKLSLILSKLSLNEQRVKYIQHSMDSLVPVQKRVKEIEHVVKSQSERLKLLEYRSLDSEARSRRRNLLFKGIPENKYENCFHEARRFIGEKLCIETDMYLERAHRLGKYDPSKTRPIIVAFRDFCDTELILNETSCSRGTDLGVSRDYPNEISKARQSIWKQYKTARENNPRKKVTFGYPASIRVNGVTIVDLFPDWYDVLKGSRTSLPQNQSNHSVQSGDRHTLSQETGSTGLHSPPGLVTSNGMPRDQAVRAAPTTGKPCPMTEPSLFNRANIESGSEIRDSDPMSQSILPQGNSTAASVTNGTSATGQSAENGKFKAPRGRSATKRTSANSVSSGKRSQSAKPRDTNSNSKSGLSVAKGRPRDGQSLSGARSKQSTSRSVSRTRDLNDPPDLNSNTLDNNSQQPNGSSDENTNI